MNVQNYKYIFKRMKGRDSNKNWHLLFLYFGVITSVEKPQEPQLKMGMVRHL